MFIGDFIVAAQSLQTVTPIVVQVAEINREFDHVHVFPRVTNSDAKPKQAASLSFSFERKSETEAESIVQAGCASNLVVHIMDGTNVIAVCKIAGTARLEKHDGKILYGLLLSFDSLEEAEAIAHLIREDWDNYFRRRLDDKSSWYDHGGALMPAFR